METNLKNVCAHIRVLLLGCGEVPVPDASPVSLFESVIVVDFKNDS